MIQCAEKEDKKVFHHHLWFCIQAIFRSIKSNHESFDIYCLCAEMLFYSEDAFLLLVHCVQSPHQYNQNECCMTLKNFPQINIYFNSGARLLEIFELQKTIQRKYRMFNKIILKSFKTSSFILYGKMEMSQFYRNLI